MLIGSAHAGSKQSDSMMQEMEATKASMEMKEEMKAQGMKRMDKMEDEKKSDMDDNMMQESPMGSDKEMMQKGKDQSSM
jgi:hypothetical protein